MIFDAAELRDRPPIAKGTLGLKGLGELQALPPPSPYTPIFGSTRKMPAMAEPATARQTNPHPRFP